MVPDRADVMAVQAALKARNPGQIVAIRLPATPAAAGRVLELARQGAEVVHLVFDAHGRDWHQCIRHTPCAGFGRHTECAEYIAPSARRAA